MSKLCRWANYDDEQTLLMRSKLCRWANCADEEKTVQMSKLWLCRCQMSKLCRWANCADEQIVQMSKLWLCRCQMSKLCRWANCDCADVRWANCADEQTVQIHIRCCLIRVYIICHSFYSYWTHLYMLKPPSSQNRTFICEYLHLSLSLQCNT